MINGGNAFNLRSCGICGVVYDQTVFGSSYCKHCDNSYQTEQLRRDLDELRRDLDLSSLKDIDERLKDLEYDLEEYR